MNRPRRPPQPPVRRRPQGPPPPGVGGQGGPPRRRSPLDNVPVVEPKFKVLGSGIDRQALQAAAQPLEMVVIQGYTREIEEAAQKYVGRYDEFWAKYPQYIDTARKLDEILASIQSRRPEPPPSNPYRRG